MPFDLITFAFALVVTLFSVVLHELAHGYTAKALGDHTAEYAGRLTLNPIPHIDPIGSIVVPILCLVTGLPGFAWAKPVPFNPANLHKDMKHGPLKVALAGPATNIVLVLIFGLAARILVGTVGDAVIAGFVFIAIINALLAVLNLIPIPPFDGFRLISLVSRRLADQLEGLGAWVLLIAFAIAYFAGGIISTIALTAVNAIVSAEAAQVFISVWR